MKENEVVRSDRGGQFILGGFKYFCDKHGIKKEYTIQGIHNKMEQLRDIIGQFNIWKDQ